MEKLRTYFRPVWMRILICAVVAVGILGAIVVVQIVKNTPNPVAECSKEACSGEPESVRNDRETSTGGGDEQSTTPQQENKPAQPGSTPKPNTPASGAPSGGSSSGGGTGGEGATPPPSGGNGTQSCPAFPAFPDENCTGVPAGVSLSSVGSQSSTSNGQTITGLTINGNLTVNHSNVTVTNTRITGRVINNASGLVMRDVDIGPDSCPASSNGGNRLIANAGYTLIRAHLHNNGADLVHLGGGSNVLIQDSLINNACFYSSDHLDAIQFYDPGGVLNATIQHSYIDIRPTNGGGFGNAAIFWADFPGSGSRLNVYNNMLIGGNYTLYGLDAHASSGVVIDVSGNRFLRNQYNYGPCALSNSVPYNGTSGVIWNNNSFSDGGVIAIGDC